MMVCQITIDEADLSAHERPDERGKGETVATTAGSRVVTGRGQSPVLGVAVDSALVGDASGVAGGTLRER
jgi:hypothetical protein